MKIAIVYDGSIRDNGTPFYFRAAFAEVLGQECDWFTPAGEIPAGYDFYVCLDDGRDDLKIKLPPGSKWGFYATDTHLDFEARLRKAAGADVIWCAQKRGAADMSLKQDCPVYWVPLGAFPAAHPTAEEAGSPPPDHDVAFVGHLMGPHISDRVAFLDAIFKAFPFFRFEFGRFHDDMAKVYHRARVGINHAVRDDINMRFFELASMGVPQLADRRMDGLADLGFMPGLHYLPYADVDEAIEQIRIALASPEQNKLMARNAFQKVRAAHTYQARARKMLDTIQAVL